MRVNWFVLGLLLGVATCRARLEASSQLAYLIASFAPGLIDCGAAGRHSQLFEALPAGFGLQIAALQAGSDPNRMSCGAVLSAQTCLPAARSTLFITLVVLVWCGFGVKIKWATPAAALAIAVCLPDVALVVSTALHQFGLLPPFEVPARLYFDSADLGWVDQERRYACLRVVVGVTDGPNIAYHKAVVVFDALNPNNFLTLG